MAAANPTSSPEQDLPTWAEIAELVAKLDAGTFADVDLQMPGFRLRMSTTPDAFTEQAPAARPRASAEPPVPTAAPAPAAAPVPTDAPEPTATATPRPHSATLSSDLVEITAPILGTFYSKPSPDVEPFVEVGSTVAADTTVAIVEVMKLMNPVSANTSGRVVEVVASDGDLVEFGQVLFRVAPDVAPDEVTR
ncbi:acetyl-CoA carboxylase biotin carboxyl carrier protein [Sphaerisporangium perillae]|uniref:acetyl-CoA carboxylase biotin carboxyl carrier protein n=1 Tax=Sphaerisporangium perillae TaxID=2935860 RepID=UPI00200CA354|nr:biotin/lipoyl-containing protein [Sphaerisporangium perillae]